MNCLPHTPDTLPEGHMDDLLRKIDDRSARLGVIGLGYVGLPLAVEFARQGFPVTGFEVDEGKIALVNAGRNYIQDVSDETLRDQVAAGRLRATGDFGALKTIDCISICVPTPLRKTKDPDLSFIMDAVARIREHLHPGLLITLESTTYPGTTDELILPELTARGFQPGQTVFLAFSPERVDPGNPVYKTHNTPKVIGGVTPECTRLAAALYGTVAQRVVPVSSTRASEMVKLLENTFRAVNIGLVNEVALMCDRLGLNVWEVIDAAATKPFGFMKFYPGPGLGGHCIPIDPHYLSWKLKTLNYTARFIELAGDVNSHMPDFVIQKLGAALNHHGRPFKGTRVLVLGMAYKRDVNDPRESPAVDILQHLTGLGALAAYHDPYIPSFAGYRSVGLEDAIFRPDRFTERVLAPETPVQARLADFDAVVVLTDHSCYDPDRILAGLGPAAILFDTRNLFAGRDHPRLFRL